MASTFTTCMRARWVVLAFASSVVCAGPAHAQQTIGGCQVLPSNNIWNTPVDTLPVLSNSASMVTTIGASKGFHADFGAGIWDGGPIGIPFVTVPGTQPKYPAIFYYAERKRRRAVRGSLERADRRWQRRNRRPSRDRARCGQLHPVRALQRVSAVVELDRRFRSHLRSAIERAAARHVDVGRCRRSADHARARHLRGGTERRHQACDPLHGRSDTPRVRVARAPLRLVSDGHAVPADGRTLPPEGQRGHLVVSGRRAGDPARHEEVRNHARRQRVVVVHLWKSPTRGGTTTICTRWVSCSARTSKRSMRPSCGSTRILAPRCRAV